jgi:hypothetical protein
MTFVEFDVIIVGVGVGRFAPVILVVEREDATGAWNWEGLPVRTLAFGRHKYATRHKSSKQHCNGHVLWKCIQKSQTETCCH